MLRKSFRTAYSHYVGKTSRAGQSAKWLKFKRARQLSQKAGKVGRGLAYLDVALSAYTLADAIIHKEDPSQPGMELMASGGTAYLTFAGSAAGPWLAIPWAGYYLSMEGIERYSEVNETQRALWESEDAARHWKLYKKTRLDLQQ